MTEEKIITAKTPETTAIPPEADHEEDFPFFRMEPVKEPMDVWKIVSIFLAVCLTVTIFMLTSPGRNKLPELGETEDPADWVTILQNRIGELEEENNALLALNKELNETNESLSKRVMELLNECNALSMQIEKGGMSAEEQEELTSMVNNYNLLIDTYIALLRGDTSAAKTNADKLVANSGQLSAEARNALYVILEYMEK